MRLHEIMELIVAGIDEAGRGPLIGDMFMVIVIIKEGDVQKLKSVGVKDSKKLTKADRERLFSTVLNLLEAVIVTRIQPHEIDSENLNILEARALCRLISHACSLLKIDRIYIDAFTHHQKIMEYIKLCNNICMNLHNIVIEYKADDKYVVVSAASIIAKVLRDSHIDMLKQFYGDFGSGYPSDKRTIEWLKTYYNEHKELPPIVRRSWKTVDKIIRSRETLDRYLHGCGL
uniref:Ribonuclease HII n=1 Tax=Ignisphaera aggregans TaxID=334771 RepID=A0A7C4H6P1_9CREN